MTEFLMDIESYPSTLVVSGDEGRRYYPIEILPAPDTGQFANFYADMLLKIASAIRVPYDQLKGDYLAQETIDLKNERKKARAFRLLQRARNQRQRKRAARLLDEACISVYEKADIHAEALRLRLGRARMNQWMYEVFYG